MPKRLTRAALATLVAVVLLSGAGTTLAGWADAQQVDVNALEIGDIITVMPYPNDSTLVTHRIVERTESSDGPSFTTRGDANDAVDPWKITEVQIRGEVRYWVPGAGYVATFLSGQTKALGTAVLALGLFGYAALQLVTAVRERRAEK